MNRASKNSSNIARASSLKGNSLKTGNLKVSNIKNSAEHIKWLKKEGWVLKSIKGSHHKFKHPDFPDPIIIPHPKKDLKIGLVSKIIKQATAR